VAPGSNGPVGMAITILPPAHGPPGPERNGHFSYAVAGTPGRLWSRSAIRELPDQPVDLVVSGINVAPTDQYHLLRNGLGGRHGKEPSRADRQWRFHSYPMTAMPIFLRGKIAGKWQPCLLKDSFPEKYSRQYSNFITGRNFLEMVRFKGGWSGVSKKAAQARINVFR